MHGLTIPFISSESKSTSEQNYYEDHQYLKPGDGKISKCEEMTNFVSTS